MLTLCVSASFAQSSRLFGTVQDEDGQPYVGLELQLEDLSMNAYTNEQGFYEFKNVAVGDYPLTIVHPYGNVYKAVYMDGADFEYNIVIRRRIEFDRITVSHTRANEEEPINKERLDAEYIEKNDLSQDLPYMLKRSRSVFVNSDAGTGIGYTGIRVRGVDPSHVNVTLNGVPVNDSESQLVFWVNMPDLLSSTESIEIQRGIGGSTFGAGDFGASVSVNTNKIRTKSYVDLTGGLGSYNSLRGTLALGTGLMNNKFTLDGRVSYINSDGYIDRASARLNSFMISAAWLGLNSSLRLNVLNGHEVTYQAWNGVPVTYADDEDLRTFNSAGQEAFQPDSDSSYHQQPWPDEVDNYTQTHVQLFFNHINDLGDWSSTLHYTRGIGYFELYNALGSVAKFDADIGDTLTKRDIVERRWLDNHFVGANVGWKKDFGKMALRSAAAYNIYLNDHFGEAVILPGVGTFDPPREYYRNDATKTDLNLFSKLEYRWNPRLLSYLDLQYRRVGYSYQGEVKDNDRLIDGSVNYNFFNPKVGLSYFPNSTTKLFLYYGRGNKEPNRDDFVDAGTNQEPLSEKMNNVELGLEKKGRNWNVGLYGYLMDYQDQLVLTGQINDVGEYARTNTDHSFRRGVEMELGWRYSGLSIVANGSYSQSKIDEFVEYLYDYDLEREVERTFSNTTMALSPEWIGFLGLAYEWKNVFQKSNVDRLRISLDHKYVGEQYLDNTESDLAKLDAFFYADAGVEYVTSLPKVRIKELAVRFRVMNVYNQLYSTGGWNFRYRTSSPDIPNPYLRSEGGNQYSETGLFPQAPIHFQSTLALRF